VLSRLDRGTLRLCLCTYCDYGDLPLGGNWTVVVENRVECCSDAAGLGGGFVDVLVESQLD